jgi:hypothetical protein
MKKKMICIFVFMLLILTIIPINTVAIDEIIPEEGVDKNIETLSIGSSPDDGYLFYEAINVENLPAYNEGRNAANAQSKDVGSIVANCGQVCDYLPPGEWHWTFYRAFFYFDTSSIPSNAIINYVEFNFYVSAVDAGDSVGVKICWDPDRVHPNQPLSLSDYGITNYVDSDTGYYPVPAGAVGWHMWIWDSDAYDVINKGGWTNFMVISTLDWYGFSSDADILMIETGESSNVPYLSIEYLSPSQPPIADAGGDYLGVINTPITFDCSNSIDNDENGC